MSKQPTESNRIDESDPTEDAAASLPGVEDRPDADIVIFDGQCVFCRRQVERLDRWDGGGRLAFVSLHDPLVAQRCPELSHDQLMEEMYVISRTGKTYGGAAAFRYLTRRLPRLWVLAPLMHLPFTLPIWQWGYRQIAKRRYRLQGKTDCDDACEIHLR